MKNQSVCMYMVICNLFCSLAWAQPVIRNYTSEEGKTVVSIQGIESPLKIMHITDSHITVENDDTLYQSYSARMAKAYEKGKHHKSGNQISRTDAFKELIQKAMDEKVDILALTGDILNYPSRKGVHFIISELDKSGTPYLYTAGNHDWHFEGMAGSSHDLREKWREEILLPLYQQANPSHTAQVVKGVNFVVIDNSTYQVTAEQLAFYREQKAKQLPIVLLMHIPVYVDNGEPFSGRMGDPQWGAAVDDGYETERRERWPESGNKKETIAFLEELYSTPALIILSGHTHQTRIDGKNGMLQLTNKPARDASCRIVELLPVQ